jgi:hypothetical protein
LPPEAAAMFAADLTAELDEEELSVTRRVVLPLE